MSDAKWDSQQDEMLYHHLDYDSILKAEKLINPHISKTNCLASHYQKEYTISLYYKLESWHKSGSFKERGVLNTLLHLPPNNNRGVIVASLGNIAIAMGMCGAKLNISVTAVIPSYIALSVKKKISDLGVNVIVSGDTLFKAVCHARQLAEENNLIYVNGRDDPHMLEGYGSIALEILRDIPFVDAIIVPVGTGGLAAAVTTVVKHDKPDCLVYGVQPITAQAFNLYKRDLIQRERELQHIKNREYMNADETELEVLREALTKIPEEYPVNTSLADSIAVSQVGVNSFANAAPLLDKLIHVTEESIAKALLHIMEVERLVVEGAAACPLASIIENLVPELKTKTVVCILTGGNMDCTVYARSLHRGMSADRRLVKFRVRVKNTTKDIGRLVKILSLGGYGIVQQNQTFRWMENDTYTQELEMVCQALSPEHGLDLKRILELAYPYNAVFETSPFNLHPKCMCFKPQKRLI